MSRPNKHAGGRPSQKHSHSSRWPSEQGAAARPPYSSRQEQLDRHADDAWHEAARAALPSEAQILDTEQTLRAADLDCANRKRDNRDHVSAARIDSIMASIAPEIRTSEVSPPQRARKGLLPYALAAAATLATATIAWNVSSRSPTPNETQVRASAPQIGTAPNAKRLPPESSKREPQAATSLSKDILHKVRPTLETSLQIVQHQGLHTRDWTHAMSRLDRNCRDATALLSHLSHQIPRRPRGLGSDDRAQRRPEAEQIVHATTVEICARLSSGIRPSALSGRKNSVIAMPMTFDIAMADAADPTVEPDRRAAALLHLERCVTDSLEAMRTTPVAGGRETTLKEFYIGRVQSAMHRLSPL